MSGSTQTDFTGWIDLMFEDACMRPFTPEIIARPGDWNYVEANDRYVHDLSDKDSDRYITINPERLISAVLDGSISYEMPHFVDAYSQFQTLTPHFAFGFLGTDQAGAYNLFLTGRAAMWQTGSWRVGSLMKDLRDLPEEMRFDWAVFPFPDLREAHEDIAPLRGVGGVGHQFCVVNKFDQAQHDRVIDFMMYLYTPEKVAYLIRRTLEVGEFIQGMPMVKGAEKELPDDILDKLKGFGGRGYTNPGLFLNDEEYDKRIRPWYQLYALGRVTVEEFLAQKQALAIELTRIIHKNAVSLCTTGCFALRQGWTQTTTNREVHRGWKLRRSPCPLQTFRARRSKPISTAARPPAMGASCFCDRRKPVQGS